ncbi:ferritin heavy chain-like [Pteropus medius]|uniref:ferritin heavy chain-like n=1 Tax=Pteropus vampyrus TaxID=132908 RepID=UPI00196B99F0|nr:ferritin heavy chain-like [Pteropus giganteus]XP_039706884.1 ferritin heavy chain-like [Pteropus giganteus]XP_039706892.1 ferritin heavy chain-like [Pteropus giganteus]
MSTALPPSCARHSYQPDCEAAVNNQINLELYASYVYESMALYFEGEDAALKHVVQFFRQQSSKETEYAQRLMWLHNQRGAHLRLREIGRPDRNRWHDRVRVMECALHLAMDVNQSLFSLHRLATEKKDARLCDFLMSRYLHEQVKFITELGDHLTNLCKMGAPQSGLAEHLFDKLTLHDSDKD